MKKFIVMVLVFILTFSIFSSLLFAKRSKQPTPVTNAYIFKCVTFNKLKNPISSGRVIEPVIPAELSKFKERDYYPDAPIKRNIRGFVVCFKLLPGEVAEFEAICKKLKIKILKKR